jgi:hypothetical protein
MLIPLKTKAIQCPMYIASDVLGIRQLTIIQEDTEFIPTQARQDIAFSQTIPNQLGNLLE